MKFILFYIGAIFGQWVGIDQINQWLIWALMAFMATLALLFCIGALIGTGIKR
jgi:hypothetical protein